MSDVANKRDTILCARILAFVPRPNELSRLMLERMMERESRPKGLEGEAITETNYNGRKRSARIFLDFFLECGERPDFVGDFERIGKLVRLFEAKG